MIWAVLLSIAMAVTLGSANRSTPIGSLEGQLLLNETCREIAAATSDASDVYDVDAKHVAASLNYARAIEHWASSSTQISACSFEPGTAMDVGIALRILGETKTPFAVKGSGHATNPGFSSTTGVQIAMTRFSDIVYNSEARTVTVGTGLIWDDVYAVLEPRGVNVVGGRISGVGVAGLTLGGGYSWLTNQYGLTIDTVQAFELVMPNGTVINVMETSRPDLFFALKVRFYARLCNLIHLFAWRSEQFCVFTLKTSPQTQVWGGLITYAADAAHRVNTATVNFGANSTDPKAVIVTGYAYTLGQLLVTEILFYDAPAPPPGIFDEFLAIPSLIEDSIFNETLVTQTGALNYTSLWHPVFVAYEAEIFLPTLLNHSTTPSRAQPLMPLNIYFAWLSPYSDQLNQDAVRTSARTLQASAMNAGQNDIANAALYPNYAIFDTPLVNMYGANLPSLQAIKAAVDPEDVMGLAGGFML
ncbi:FAD dependent oxidoreductase [Boletus edulis]|nr:FAD dependent oxidoreductase [Boletus edulis]